jgi:two-component system sensor histidine kinase KdpD
MNVMWDFLAWVSNRSRAARLGLAVLCALLATAIALPLRGTFTTGTVPALIYLLGVLAAAMVGGFRGGMTASIISFLGLNFFFTPPFHTFEVEKPEDIVALFVFLIVASVVANLLTQLLRQKERAQSRERETRVLYEMASRLLGSVSTNGVIDDFARELSELLGLSRCEVHISDGNEALQRTAVYEASDMESNSSELEVPLRTDRERFGVVKMLPSKGIGLDMQQRALAEAFVTQAALALETAKLQEQTRAAQAEAETSRVRAALFSAITHDLRTPLSSIKAAATSLLEEGVSFQEQQRIDLLKTIAEESDRLNRLIGNLLGLSRLRAGALRPEKVPTPIEDVIEAVTTRLRKTFDDRKIQLKIREPLPPVPMDVVQIDQVLTNLLENAFRYSPADSEVEVTASRWQHTVEVKVADRGRGIPQNDRERVFEEFYRGEASSTSGGAGLGLSIAQAIVQAHNGAMWIHETPGGGTTVGFRLPLTYSE